MVQTIRGLTTGSAVGTMTSPFAPVSGPDVKLSLSQQVVYTQSTITNELAPETFISNSGGNSNSGSILAPRSTIPFIEPIFPNTIIFTADTFALGSNYATYTNSWIGKGTDQTTISGANITLNDTAWQGTTAPEKIMKGVSLSLSGNLTFAPSAFVANSSYIFDDFSYTSGSNNLSLAQNAIFKNYINLGNLVITDVANIQIPAGGVYNSITINVSDGVSVSDSVAKISNIYCPTLNFIVDPLSSGPGNLSVTLGNIQGLSAVHIADDSSFGVIQFVNADMATASLNPAISGSASSTWRIIGDLSTSANLNAGFGLTSSTMSFGGNSGARAYTLQAGNNGNSVSNVSLSTILGRSASSFNDVFMASDSSGSLVSALATRTATMQYTNGGKFIMPSLSIGGQVQEVEVSATYNTTATISATDLVSGPILSTPASAISLTFPTASNIKAAMTPILLFTNSTIKRKIINLSSTNSISLINTDANLLVTGLTTTVIQPGQTLDLEFSVTNLSTPQVTIYGGISLPDFTKFAKIDNQTFTGVTKLNAFLVSTNWFLSNIVAGPYSSASTLLTAMDIISGTITCNPTAAQTTQLPTASNFETFVSGLLGFTVPINTTGFFTIENISTTALSTTTMTANTGFNIGCNAGVPVIPLTQGRAFKWIKLGIGSYAIYSN